jgi:D-alanine-D-alanine ligase-like ATP-grasp enzyme
MGSERQWFPYLDKVVPVLASTAERVSLYTIALEGWRRGLTLKFYRVFKGSKVEITYSLALKDKIHYFEVSKGDKVSQEAMEVCENKWLTKEYLTRAGVPVPKGKSFSEDTADELIVKAAKELGFPLVLKPVDGSSGRGVITNINDVKYLRDSLIDVRQRQKKKKVIIEQYYTGDEFRIYVVNGKVIGAVNRIPANVTADGSHSIAQLIDQKNELRKQVPHLYNRPIKIDKELIRQLEQAGLTLDTVPQAGEKIYLKKVSNVSAGGDPVDVTDELTPTIKEIAVNAVKAVPGLVQCGVDMMVDDNRESGVIIELNTKAGIGSHLFPVKGRSRDVPGAIIDYYFPETAGINTKESKVYFDFKSVVEPLQGGTTEEVEVTPPPARELFVKKYIITFPESGPDQKFLNWVEEEASVRKYSGDLKMISETEAEMVIAGRNREEISDFKVLLLSKWSGHVQSIDEQNYEFPVKTGFELQDLHGKINLYSLEEELEKKYKDLKQARKAKHKLDKENKKIRESKSWKITAPLRRAGALLKTEKD